MLKLFNLECGCGNIFEELLGPDEEKSACPKCQAEANKQPFSFDPTVENNVHWKEAFQKSKILKDKYLGKLPYSKNRYSQSD
jgi:hypothetical protein